MEPLPRLARALGEAQVRFVLIGVWAVNLYARAAAAIFTTHDYDLLLPPDADHELRAWEACVGEGLALWLGDEPLGQPRDRWLAEQVVAGRSLVRASDGRGFDVDLVLAMAGFEWDEVWSERRVFSLQGVEVPVARLRHVVESKAAAGREKDRLFLASHAEVLKGLLRDE
jgi:hypothetical protein